MRKRQNNLEDAINFCIVNANRGKAIAVDSKEMQDIVSYIKSLGIKDAPGYGTSGYGEKISSKYNFFYRVQGNYWTLLNFYPG